MEIRKFEPSFGMVRYGAGVEDYIKTLGHHDAINFRVIGIRNRENPIGIDLSLVKRFGKTRLKAELGVKSYIENIFVNPICTLKRAIKNANRIFEHQQFMKKETEGMKIPRPWD